MCIPQLITSRHLTVRRGLLIFKYIPLKTRRAVSLYKVYSDSTLLALNGASLNSESALLSTDDIIIRDHARTSRALHFGFIVISNSKSMCAILSNSRCMILLLLLVVPLHSLNVRPSAFRLIAHSPYNLVCIENSLSRDRHMFKSGLGHS